MSFSKEELPPSGPAVSTPSRIKRSTKWLSLKINLEGGGGIYFLAVFLIFSTGLLEGTGIGRFLIFTGFTLKNILLH